VLNGSEAYLLETLVFMFSKDSFMKPRSISGGCQTPVARVTGGDGSRGMAGGWGEGSILEG